MELTTAPQEQPTEKTTDNVVNSEETTTVDTSETVTNIDSDASSIESLAKDLEVKSKSEIIDYLAKIIQEHTVAQLRNEIESVKIAFYKKHNAELEVLKNEFFANNSEDSKFVPEEDKLEVRLKELLTLYRSKRDAFVEASEAQKEENYKAKVAIIEQLKELSNSSETMHSTFETFKELQHKFKEIGLVPQALVRDLWETYNHHIEVFYNYIKINKELRDLDLKRNYEAKVDLCAQAEELSLESDVVNAFHKLQKLHDAWRETGPVAIEFKEVLWERFKNASTVVNKRHQDYFDSIREEQLANFAIKSGLCEQIELLAEQKHSNRAEWESASEKVIEIQKGWKAVGFAPKKDNNKVYERFRAACDKFFEEKRNFFDEVKGQLQENYQAKINLCIQAEALSESTDWKKTTEEIINLQKLWKATGATSRKQSEEIWNRFRTACDKFFEAKSKHFENNNAQFSENLTAKETLIKELEGLDASSVNFEQLKEYQKRWSDIGFVPAKVKDELNKRYKVVIDGLFDALRGGESVKRINKFKENVSALKDNGKVSSERDKLFGKMKALENEIQTLENNIGFFGKSKGAEALIKEVQNKIDKAKSEIAEIIEKIKIIDNK